MFNQKTRMISFRVSEENFRLLREVCIGEGFGSCSDLVRTAVQELISNRSQCGPAAVAGVVQDLIIRLELLDQNLKNLVDSVNVKVVRGLSSGGERVVGQPHDLLTNSPNNSAKQLSGAILPEARALKAQIPKSQL